MRSAAGYITRLQAIRAQRAQTKVTVAHRLSRIIAAETGTEEDSITLEADTQNVVNRWVAETYQELF